MDNFLPFLKAGFMLKSIFFLEKTKANFISLVSLAPRMDLTSYVHQYYRSGYLVFQEGGEAGKVETKLFKRSFPHMILNLISQKVCADHMNRTVPREEVGRVLEKLGKSMCTMLEFKDLEDIRIKVLKNA